MCLLKIEGQSTRALCALESRDGKSDHADVPSKPSVSRVTSLMHRSPEAAVRLNQEDSRGLTDRWHFESRGIEFIRF